MRDVAPQHWLEVGVQHRGGEPLVLAELGLDLEGGADRNIRKGGAEGGGDAVLVLRIAKREQQTHRARFGPARTHLLHHRGDRLLGGLDHRLAGRIHPLRDLESVTALDERRRVVLGQRVHVRASLAADLQQIAEAAGGDHRDPAAAALDEGVGTYRGAVGEPPERRRIDPVPRGEDPATRR